MERKTNLLDSVSRSLALSSGMADAGVEDEDGADDMMSKSAWNSQFKLLEGL